MKKIISFLIISVFFIPSLSFAHPGRTDFKGGHTCKTNCTSFGLRDGEYHLHAPKAKDAKIKSKSTAKSSVKSKSR